VLQEKNSRYLFSSSLAARREAPHILPFLSLPRSLLWVTNGPYSNACRKKKEEEVGAGAPNGVHIRANFLIVVRENIEDAKSTRWEVVHSQRCEWRTF